MKTRPTTESDGQIALTRRLLIVLLLGSMACVWFVLPAQNLLAERSTMQPTPTPLSSTLSSSASIVSPSPMDDVSHYQHDSSTLLPLALEATGSRHEGSGGPAPLDYWSVVSFSQGFDDVTQLPNQGWFFQNNSTPLGTTNWFQGNAAVFSAHAGTPAGYIAANFNNTIGVGTISNWMLTPVFSLINGETISFRTRTVTGSVWPDRLELRLSTSGDSTDVGSTVTSVGAFTTLLLSVDSSLTSDGYPDAWTRYSVTLTGIPSGATGRFAIRYYVTDGGPNGGNSDYIGIDTIEYTGSLADFACSAVTQIPQTECQALVTLFNSTDGAGWINRDGWLSTNTPCNWHGVTCDAGRVTILALGNNALNGSIPAQIGTLTQLTNLNLSYNQLSGTIPLTLSNLTRLRWLGLHSNRLSGSIPSTLNGLSALQFMGMWGNQLSGSIPVEIGNLVNLQAVDLGSNQLSGSIPRELGNLTNLQSLLIGNNQLSGSIPTELGNLSNLRYLKLSNNQMSGTIPYQLGNLRDLLFLDLSSNHLTGGIPTQLGLLGNLQWLGLYNNQLSGGIPSQVGTLTNIQFLLLGANRLSGTIPSQLGNLARLQELHLSSNELGGSIPFQLCDLTISQYSNFDFGYNKLAYGPPCIANLDPDWMETQTVAPGNVQATAQAVDQVRLTWSPIQYIEDGGYYEISYATASGGPFVIHGTTYDKHASSYVVSSLSSGTAYFFRVRTYTPAHGVQQNNLWSDYSVTVSSMTWTPTPTQTPTSTATGTATPTATSTSTATPPVRFMYIPALIKADAPTPTPTATQTATPTSTPLPSVINGGFENGLAGWNRGGSYVQPQVRTDVVHNGARSVALGNPDEACTNSINPRRGDSWVSQVINVPNTNAPQLTVWYRIFTWDNNSQLSDSFDRFEIWLNNSRIHRDANRDGNYGCNRPPTDLGWQRFTYNLSAYRGQQVTLKLSNIVWPDEAYNTWTYVDDIAITP